MRLAKGAREGFGVVLLLRAFHHLSGEDAGRGGVVDHPLPGGHDLLALSLSAVVEVGEVAVLLETLLAELPEDGGTVLGLGLSQGLLQPNHIVVALLGGWGIAVGEKESFFGFLGFWHSPTANRV